MGSTLVFNMPGSVRAVEEYTSEVFKSIKHMIYMLHGLDIH
jgi:molybdopterin biosynthesis enzyme MoaB